MRPEAKLSGFLCGSESGFWPPVWSGSGLVFGQAQCPILLLLLLPLLVLVLLMLMLLARPAISWCGCCVGFAQIRELSCQPEWYMRQRIQIGLTDEPTADWPCDWGFSSAHSHLHPRMVFFPTFTPLHFHLQDVFFSHISVRFPWNADDSPSPQPPKTPSYMRGVKGHSLFSSLAAVLFSALPFFQAGLSSWKIGVKIQKELRVCELCERLCVSVCVQGVLRNYFVCKIMRIAYGEKSGKKHRKKELKKVSEYSCT